MRNPYQESATRHKQFDSDPGVMIIPRLQLGNVFETLQRRVFWKLELPDRVPKLELGNHKTFYRNS